jgi:hypothetical protein
VGDALGIVHAIEVAGERSDHDRELPDGRDDGFLPVIAMDESEPELDRGRVCEIAKPGFAGIEFSLRPVRFPHEGLFDFDRAQFNPDRIIVLAPVLDVGLDDPLFIYHFLEIVLQEIIERVKLVARNMLP